MSPYVGEIRIFAGNFAPLGWLFCQGQAISIAENDILFQLIGTTYGGDGVTYFNLPDLRGRTPIHQGALAGGGTYILGEIAGVEQVTLTTNQLPAHNHLAQCLAFNGTAGSPAGAYLAGSPTALYQSGAAAGQMNPNSISGVGGSQPHENRPPYLALSYIISMQGIYPSQS
jgi:microcystin-dependent protein